MANNHQTVGRSLLPNTERERDALLTIRQLEKRLIELHTYRNFIFIFLKIRLRQIIREVDAPFVSRHNEYSDIYNELVNEKNAYEQEFNTESNLRN
jgi:hypothetical protein